MNGFLFYDLLPLRWMKKNKLIVSLLMVVTVLFSILFQAFHTYEHIATQLSEKQCDHKYNISGTEITHQHHHIDHCYVCHFAISSYISPAQFSYQLVIAYSEIPYFTIDNDAVVSFSGSLYSQRGPPVNS
ncbi:putative membrane protein [Flavobacterium sp. PL11]|jgi:uncharacterized membrane protein|uniref:hypothetical protein n=1 Tax=Flavobacterium sp. PL11 TaxID=3071717 RepID=UPI002DFF738D|nr:putative membrane protein [Flavobacterium sp. PL11]